MPLLVVTDLDLTKGAKIAEQVSSFCSLRPATTLWFF